MELSARLQCIAQEVPDGARFADIGTDHAYLPVWLLKEGKIGSAIAADVRPGPLSRAEDTARRFDMIDRMRFRLCDGLSDIRPDEADTVAIAGMGGETIVSILSNPAWMKADHHLFLLQPMSSIPELRGWLQENRFCILREHIIAEEGKYYVIMVVRKGDMPTLSPGERWAGCQRKGMDAPLRAKYLDDLLQRLKRALAGVGRSQTPQSVGRRLELEKVFEDLKKMKKEWQAWQR